MKKIFITLFMSLLLLAGCKKDDNPKGNEETNLNYKITVYDLDGELLVDDTISATSNENLFERLKNDYNATYEESNYGPYLTSVANSIIDKNYYVAIYENDSYATSGVSDLVVDNNDHFTFKIECFNNEFDEYDLMLDKAIYSYMKNYFKDIVSKEEEFSTSMSEFWSYMMVSMARANGYDNKVFNLDFVKDKMLKSLEEFDVNTLTGQAIGKYYYVARALDYNLTDYFNFYEKFASENTYPFSEYTSPFIMRPAASLENKPAWLDEYVNASLASDYWGPDGAAWQLMIQSYFRDIKKDELLPLTGKLDWDYSKNATSKSLVLAAFASCGYDLRSEEYEVDGVDMLEDIFNKYYIDGLVCYNEDTLEPNMSTSQIYAYLMNYKVFRDSRNKVTLFA